MKNTLIMKKIFDLGIQLVVSAIESHHDKPLGELSDQEVLDALRHPKVGDLIEAARTVLVDKKEDDNDVVVETGVVAENMSDSSDNGGAEESAEPAVVAPVVAPAVTPPAIPTSTTPTVPATKRTLS